MTSGRAKLRIARRRAAAPPVPYVWSPVPSLAIITGLGVLVGIIAGATWQKSPGFAGALLVAASVVLSPWLAYVVIRAAVQHATADRFSALGEDVEAVRVEVARGIDQAHADAGHEGGG